MTTALYILAALYLLWLGYVFTMHVKAQWDVLHWSAKVLGAPVALAAQFITIADPRTAGGLAALVSGGLITEERRAAIVGAMQ